MKMIKFLTTLFLVLLIAQTALAGVHKNRRVIILGIDGLRPEMLEQYLTKPKYAKLRAQGFLANYLKKGRLTPQKTIAAFPSYTWPMWGVIYTGHFPGKHGIMGQTFLLRDKKRFFNVYRKFVDGPSSYGYVFDVKTGQAKLNKMINKLPRLLRGLAKKGVAWLEKVIAKKQEGFTFAKLLGGMIPRGHTAVNTFIQVPTVYDYARQAGLNTWNVYNFWHHRSAKPGVPEGFTRPSPNTLLKIGVSDMISEKLWGGTFEKIFRKILKWSKKLGKFLGPLVAPLRKLAAKAELLAPVSFLPEKYVNQVRGHVWFDQLAAAEAIKVFKKHGVPHVFNIYQNAPDSCAHYIKGDLTDIMINSLAFVDRNLKPVVAYLKKTKTFKDTLFVFVSDHGHTNLKKYHDDKTTAKLMKVGGMGKCDYIAGNNGSMSHIYLVSQKSSLPDFKALKCKKRGKGKTALTRAPGLAAQVAARLAKSAKKIPAGYAAIFARGADNRYRIYYARKGKKIFAYPKGLDIKAFERSAANKVVGLYDPAYRMRMMNNPDRSGDIILATAADEGYSYDQLPSTHGGMQYGDSIFTLTFFGPPVTRAGVKGNVKLRTAYQTDVAPSILSYLGINVGKKMTGRPLFNDQFKPLGLTKAAPRKLVKPVKKRVVRRIKKRTAKKGATKKGAARRGRKAKR